MLALGSCKGTEQTREAQGRQSTTPSGDRASIAFQNHFFEAMQHRSTGDLEKAYAAFNSAKAEDASKGAVFYELARIDFELDRSTAAMQNIDEAIELEPENYWYRREKAYFLLQLSRYEDAIDELEWLIKERPEDLEAYYDLATAYLYLENGREAIKVYDKLEERMGIDPEIIFQKQRIYLLLGDTEKAIAELDKLIESYGAPEFYAQKAQILMEIGQTVEALNTLERLVERDPDNGVAHFTLSRIYASEGEDEKSWESLQIAFGSPDVGIDEKIGVLLNYMNAALGDRKAEERTKVLLGLIDEVHPDEAKTHSIHGDFLLQRERFEEARDRFAMAVDLDPVRPLIWLQLIELDARLSDWEQMEVHSKQAKDLYPTQAPFYLMLGNAYLRQEQPKEAIQTLRTGQSFVVEDPGLELQFLANLAEAYHAAGEHQKSDEAFEKAIKIDNRDPFILNNYSYYLAVRGQKLARAKELSARSLELRPNTPSFLDTYGWVLFKMGSYEESLQYIEQAMSLAGPDPELYEHLGDVLFHLNRTAEAVDAWREALNSGGTSEVLKKKVADQKYYAAP